MRLMTKADSTPTNPTTKKSTSTEAPLIGPNTVLELTIDAKTAAEAYARILKRAARSMKTDGFRRGKVPAGLVESMVDQEKLVNEVLQEVVPPVFEAELKKSGYLPLTYPEFKVVSVEKGKDWKIETHIAQKPEIKLGSYQKVVKEALKAAKKHEDEMAKEREKAQKAAKEDASTAKAEASHADHAHDDEAHQRDHFLQHIYADLVKALKPTIPELLVKEDVRSELETLVRQLQGMKLDLDTFLKQRQMSFEQLSQELTYQSLGRLQLTFILDAITDQEKIEVTEADRSAAMEKVTDEDLKKRYQTDERYQTMLTQTLQRQKLADFLLKM